LPLSGESVDHESNEVVPHVRMRRSFGGAIFQDDNPFPRLSPM
jgi:hypothetical protein